MMRKRLENDESYFHEYKELVRDILSQLEIGSVKIQVFVQVYRNKGKNFNKKFKNICSGLNTNKNKKTLRCKNNRIVCLIPMIKGNLHKINLNH